MSGMVVPAGSGARQFHVKWSSQLRRAVDFAIWVTGLSLQTCTECGGPAYEVLTESFPEEVIAALRQATRQSAPIACPKCNGSFIE